MITKHAHYNRPFEGKAPRAAIELEEDGHALLSGAFSPKDVAELRREIEAVYRDYPPDHRPGSTTAAQAEMYRYEMFNRSSACQAAISRPQILDVVEPLLGEDCHVVSCTAWRNPAGNESAPRGLQWHVDGGPYIARRPDQTWPAHIPYPVFVVTSHLYLQDVTIADGPTAILPGSHKSGRLPPQKREWDTDLTYEGRGAAVHVARAGDVTLFVSETWHRRMPPSEMGRGRFFLQTVYGRREVAQRVRLTEELNAVGPAALARTTSDRERQLLGIHPAAFYDG